MRTRLKGLSLLMVLGLVLAACGGDPGTDTITAEEPDTTTASDDMSDTTAEPATDGETTMADMEIATDFGVDLEAGTIKVGMLSDLTGPFGPLVSAILAGTEAYWTQVNEAGGINGLQVELVTRDTQYVVDNHVALYAEIKDEVVAIGHSTGSPHTVAIAPALAEDGVLAIPLTWYSGWSDPALNANLLSHGTPYCIEAMNTLGYIKSQTPDIATIAIASLPGDYGQDSVAGAKLAAEALGLEVAYDGEAAIVPTDETTLTAVADGVAGAGADVIWIATTPTTYSAIYGQALAAGVDAIWSGPSPSWSPAFVAPDSQIKDAIAGDFIAGTYTVNWASEEPAAAAIKEALTAAGAPPSDYYFEGVVEARLLHQALLAAYESGDMTRAGVLAAGKGLENVDFDGLAPAESYVGEPNDRLQRSGYIFTPDPEGLAAGTSAGTIQVESEYTSEIAAAYEFTGACYSLEG